MFKVQFQNNGIAHKVYDVGYDNFGGLKFLFFIDGKWQWRKAKDYTPIDE